MSNLMCKWTSIFKTIGASKNYQSKQKSRKNPAKYFWDKGFLLANGS